MIVVSSRQKVSHCRTMYISLGHERCDHGRNTTKAWMLFFVRAFMLLRPPSHSLPLDQAAGHWHTVRMCSVRHADTEITRPRGRSHQVAYTRCNMLRSIGFEVSLKHFGSDFPLVFTYWDTLPLGHYFELLRLVWFSLTVFRFLPLSKKKKKLLHGEREQNFDVSLVPLLFFLLLLLLFNLYFTICPTGHSENWYLCILFFFQSNK